MKKVLLKLISVSALCIMLAGMPLYAMASDKTTAEDWTLTRAEIDYTDKGIVISQTEMGVPDNHAIAILNVPFDKNSIEVELSIQMEDFSSSSRNPNDVWAAVNFMGVPSFFNWRNSEQYGYAKDTPGIVNRFLSYDGDLRIISDVYQKDYHTTDDENAEIVDTWTLLKASSGAKVGKTFKIKLLYETIGENTFYNLYINDTLITTSGEFAFVEKDIAFPQSLYLTVVMNTQDKVGNEMSKITIKSINGVSYAAETTPPPDNGKGSDFPVGIVLIAAGAVIAGAAAFIIIRKSKGSKSDGHKS